MGAGILGMKIEDVRRVAVGMRKLRNKEMTSKLTYGEQQELEELLKLESKKFPDYNEKQMVSKVNLTAIRNYKFKDITPKENILQKLFKKENIKEYEIQVLNVREDLAESTWKYSFALDFRQLMEDVGLGLDWPKMMPVQDDMAYYRPNGGRGHRMVQIVSESSLVLRQTGGSKRFGRKGCCPQRRNAECHSLVEKSLGKWVLDLCRYWRFVRLLWAG